LRAASFVTRQVWSLELPGESEWGTALAAEERDWTVATTMVRPTTKSKTGIPVRRMRILSRYESAQRPAG
jgi:hypothetical protein